MSAILVCPIHPVSCHFKGILSNENRNRPMFDPCIHSSAEEPLDLFRAGGRSDIPVLRPPRQDGIPHAPAHGECFVSVELKIINDHHHFPWQCYLHE